MNFGHTVGHALESQIGYNVIKHGEAVSYGMKCASWISKEKGLLTDREYQIINETIGRLPLPELKNLNIEKVMEFISFDKNMIKVLFEFCSFRRTWKCSCFSRCIA